MDALFLTGAAARISQEVAIVDLLRQKMGLELHPRKTFLAGFSSGALNLAAINACFRENDPLDWELYFKQDTLFPISTDDVFLRKKQIPFNTEPLRNIIDKFLNDAKFERFSDLPFQSDILAFSYLRLNTPWFSNQDAKCQQASVSDLLMASSAIPLLFPDQHIRKNNSSELLYRGKFGDGGIGGSFRAFEKHLKKFIQTGNQLDRMFIVSPMREVAEDDYEELNYLIPSTELFNVQAKEMRIFKFFMEMISQNGFDTFIKKLHRWVKKHPVAKQIYVCVPKMEKNFPILTFDRQEEQYKAVVELFQKHPDQLAVPLNKYVQQFERRPLEKITISLERRLMHRWRAILRR